MCRQPADRRHREHRAAGVDPKFHFIRQDILKPLRIAGPVDEIYNMACPASPPRYQRDPVHTFRTCTEGSLNLLNLAVQKNARILQSSTSEVYGDPDVSLQKEKAIAATSTPSARAPGDEGKRAAETLFWEYGTHRGRDPDRPHLQHLRPADAPRRRPRGVEFHRPVKARPVDDDLWRRLADPQLLLCRRHG
ncbi:MAG: GDP-mannose 4,6-dehydratase [Paracoccaceae bacterium]